ncbi:3-deoxy-manno-octulosonate cytidylyltransferase [Bartonella tamiae]|uniref:3-deoxy-manno-octulosonate cytidylyltransferase n=1 Tax=Bartonella tamiae Th239 TaxID=1094558 RepID=J1K2E3_9HYPH|nr:3-deoxy-manno-octulosonate cytidylyltransferase [Bartonella tamiae]EJF91280.1 3-deoxy-D-manno-octulosonate cytidylyltransferase [Bartonella tamiae Th239]EJF93055.1 3-deoxy-D-manno-octulosonate cytidylyltransferase [Bartonella tamiae Th307]
MTSKTLILIPARMESTRLPGKPLADIVGKPMIVHVAERALLANLGKVVVATDHSDVVAALQGLGIEVMMTRRDHQSGSDRIFEALTKSDPEKYFDTILNLQGDLPTLSSQDIQAALLPLHNASTDIGTVGVEIIKEQEKHNPNVVKIVGTYLEEKRMRALYFTRATAPYGEGPLYHHIGLYAYRRKALEKFVTLPPSLLEQRESLEQLRALEAGMRIDVQIVNTVPLGVDTPEDLHEARNILRTT